MATPIVRLRFPRIHKLTLHNFSLFSRKPNLSVQFPDGVFCLAGANGLGKSTFIAALNFGLTGIVSESGRRFTSTDEYYKYSKVLWDKRLPLMIQAYFEDVENVLKDLRRWATSNANMWFIVSTSAYAGVEIPVDLITAYVGERAGWSLKELGVIRRLRPSGQHTNKVSGITVTVPRLRESVVIFDAAGEHKAHRP